MSRIVVLFVLSLAVGCSGGSDPMGSDRVSGGDAAEDGGEVQNVDRERAEAYFAALSKVRSAEEEGEVLFEFGEWLREGKYRVRVEVKDGIHVLSCPYFPPVTPWIAHSFFEVENLGLLPRLDEGG